MLIGLRPSSLSTSSSGLTTSASRRLGDADGDIGVAGSTSRISVVDRDAITCSGPMPYQAAAAGRMKCTPLPEQIQTVKPFARKSARSSFIGWNVTSP